MRIQRAKPRWNDRLRMEREGAVLGLDGAEISAAEAAAAARARRHADAGPSSGGRMGWSTPRIRRFLRSAAATSSRSTDARVIPR